MAALTGFLDELRLVILDYLLVVILD